MRLDDRIAFTAGVALGVAILMASSAFALPQMRVKWTFDVKPIVETGFAWTIVVLADLNGDGMLETILGTEKGGRMVAVGPTGNLLWVFPPADSDMVPQLIAKAFSVDDLDGDGKPEIVFGWGAAPNGAVFCINWDGTLKWKWSSPEAHFRYGGALARDFDGDGKKEVVVAGSDAKVYMFTHTGELRWVSFLPPGRSVDSMVNAFDIDRDGQIEVLAFSRSLGEGPGTEGGLNGVFYCLDGRTGMEKWSWSSPLWVDWLHNMPTIADVNGDGEYEIVFGLWRLDSGADGGMVVISFYGTEVARKHVTGNVAHNAMLGDIDGDGKPEIFMGIRGGLYYCLGPDLKEKWAFNITKVIGKVARPVNMGGALGDVTGDGKINVVFQSWQNNSIIVLDNQGKLAAEPYNLKVDATGSVALGDVDKDGKVDIVAFAGPTLYCLTLDAPYKAGTMVWPMYGKDAANSGVILIPETALGLLAVLALPLLRKR